MAATRKKLGVRPETHEGFARVADATGWSVSVAVDYALAALIKSRRLNVKFESRRPRVSRPRVTAA